VAEVGSAYLTILPSFKGGSKAIANQLDGKGAGQQVGADIGTGIGGVAGKVFAPLAAALGALSIGAFVKDTIRAAGDLEQSVGAVDSVFRSSASQIHEWSKGAATAVGLSSDAFNQSASVIGAMLTNYGVAQDQVASSTNTLIGYGSDLAAMFGGTTQEAVDALGAALRGEADPAERFGLSLNKTAVTAHMAATGIDNQAEATLDLIRTQMEASGAMGQFAREGETLQGAQQRLAAGWSNIQASIGQLFLPAAAAATGALANFLPYIQRVVDGIAGLQTLFNGGGFSASIREAFNIEEDSGVVDFVARLGESFRGAGGGFSGLLAVAQEAFWSVVQWLSTGGIQSIVDAILAGRERLFSAALQIFPAILDAVTTVLPEVVEWITQTMLPQLVSALTTLVPSLVTMLGSLIPQIVSTITGALPSLLQAAVTLFSSLLTAVTTVLPMLLTTIIGMIPGILTTIVGMIPQILTAGIGAFMALVQAVLTILPTLLTTLLGTVLPMLLTTILGMLPQLLTTAVDAFFALVTAILTVLPQLITVLLTDVLPTLIETVLGMIPVLLTTAIDLFLSLVTAIADALPQIVSALIGILPVLVASLLGLVPRLIPAAIQMFLALVTGLVQAVPQILVALWDLGESIIQTLGDIDLVEIGKDLIRGLMDGIGQMASGLLDAVLGPVQDAVDGVKDFLGIHSPSRLFAEIGTNTMLGLTGGIEAESKRLDATMSGVANRMEVGVRPLVENGAATAGSGNSGPLVEQKIYPQPGMSEMQVGDIAGRRVVAAMSGVVIP
jgi:phage-related protein